MCLHFFSVFYFISQCKRFLLNLKCIKRTVSVIARNSFGTSLKSNPSKEAFGNDNSVSQYCIKIVNRGSESCYSQYLEDGTLP